MGGVTPNLTSELIILGFGFGNGFGDGFGDG